MGFQKQIKKDLTNFSKYAGGKAGGTVGKSLHSTLMKNDDTHREYIKLKAKFMSSLSGADRLLYNNICDLEKDRFNANSTTYNLIITRGKLERSRRKLSANLTDYQKELFTKVNRLAANVLKEEAQFSKTGARLGKMTMSEVNKKFNK